MVVPCGCAAVTIEGHRNLQESKRSHPNSPGVAPIPLKEAVWLPLSLSIITPKGHEVNTYLSGCVSLGSGEGGAAVAVTLIMAGISRVSVGWDSWVGGTDQSI